LGEGVGEEGLADADRADEGDVGVGVEEAQRGLLVEERAIEGHLRGTVPRLQDHGRVQAGLLHPQRDAQAVTPCDLIASELGQRGLQEVSYEPAKLRSRAMVSDRLTFCVISRTF
jgi:hypothetical protein